MHLTAVNSSVIFERGNLSVFDFSTDGRTCSCSPCHRVKNPANAFFFSPSPFPLLLNPFLFCAQHVFGSSRRCWCYPVAFRFPVVPALQRRELARRLLEHLTRTTPRLRRLPVQQCNPAKHSVRASLARIVLAHSPGDDQRASTLYSTRKIAYLHHRGRRTHARVQERRRRQRSSSDMYNLFGARDAQQLFSRRTAIAPCGPSSSLDFSASARAAASVSQQLGRLTMYPHV